MRTYKMTISYDGTRYQGWQRQAMTDNTIQHILEWTIGRMVGYRVQVDGSGRTDSGVHARGQVASVKLSKLYDVEDLKDALNRSLPEDIRIIRVELVRKLKADGVHLGKNDMPIAEARKILGKDFLIGGTANTFDDVQAHYEAGADYIGCGPFRFTTTKEKLSPILGLEGYRSIVQQMKAEGIHLPIVAIGGITLEDIPAIMQTGVTGIALSGTILRAANPVEETKKIVSQLKMNNE